MTAYTQKNEKDIRIEGVAISRNDRLDRLKDIKLICPLIALTALPSRIETCANARYCLSWCRI